MRGTRNTSVPSFSDLAFRTARAVRNFERPERTVAQSLLRRSQVRVVDRKTRLSFDVRRGAERMFSEILHARCYDLPSVPVRPGDVVLDVGANHGFYGCLAAWQGARVLAFEPDPASVPLLRNNIVRNGLAEAVKVEVVAITGSNGRASFGSSATMGGGRSALTDLRSTESDMSLTEVHTRSLAAVVEHHALEHIRICKLDCEGAELAILRDSPPDVLSRIDAVALEYHPELYDLADLIGAIEESGIFHIGRFTTTDYVSYILHLVNRRALVEWASGSSA